MLRPLLASAFLVALISLPWSVRAEDTTSLKSAIDDARQAGDADIWAFGELEPVVSASPAAAVGFSLPVGALVRDFEVSPRGDRAAVVVEDAAHRQSIGFWQFSADGFVRTVEVPADAKIASLTWQPQATGIFLLATDAAGSRILEIDPAKPRFEPRLVYKTDKALRRLVVGGRPFATGPKGERHYRLFFGERQGAAYALKTVTDIGDRLYTVVGPEAEKLPLSADDDMPPSTTVAPSALPVAFHPAGNALIWEDAKGCLHRTDYEAENWGKTRDFGKDCGAITAYTPNGIATLEWRSGAAGLVLSGLVDKSRRTMLGDVTLTSPPSQMPDGRGVVATVAAADGRTGLRFLPIEAPLADVANAWMYLADVGDQQRFVKDRGLLRGLAGDEQIYQLYDSESYACGAQDSRIATRPYLVTTDLFWEVYGAAFDGLFIVVERDRAMPAFGRFLDAATASLQKIAAASRLGKALTAAQAVLNGHEAGNAEAGLILAAAGPAASPALGEPVDYAQFQPRGHYKTEAQKRYFAAMRYLTLIRLTPEEVALLRGLDPAVAKAAGDWIDSYRPFIAASRLDLVWDEGKAKAAIASHSDGKGARLFPLSWAWDNEALDNVVYHSDWPAAEQIVAADGSKRLLPSALDFPAVAGSAVARSLLDRQGVLEKYPNLAARIDATRQRFAANSRSGGSLYEDWIAALATQWANTAAKAGTDGPLWQAKRLQTGLASWATLRHSTVLVNDQVSAECGEGGFEDIVMRPPRGYVEPDPASFGAIAALFESTAALLRAGTDIVGGDTALRDGIIRRLEAARGDARTFQKIAQKELAGETLSPAEYKAIQFVGGAVEHNFLIFMSLSNADYALSTPDPMMKVADIAGSAEGSLEVAVGRPLEWDQVVPYFGRREIVKGAVYSFYDFVSAHPIDDAAWRGGVDKQARPGWIRPYVTDGKLDCPAREP